MCVCVHKNVCMHACIMLVMAKLFENPWTKAMKLVNKKYSLKTQVTSK